MARILVIDDADLNLELVKRYLERHDHSIETSNSPIEALQKLSTTQYDLILLDIIMPEKNGIEVLKLIQQGDINKTTPVIMLSARDDMNSIQDCLTLGAVDYITKPFDLTDLQQRIAEYL